MALSDTSRLAQKTPLHWLNRVYKDQRIEKGGPKRGRHIKYGCDRVSSSRESTAAKADESPSSWAFQRLAVEILIRGDAPSEVN